MILIIGLVTEWSYQCYYVVIIQSVENLDRCVCCWFWIFGRIHFTMCLVGNKAIGFLFRNMRWIVFRSVETMTKLKKLGDFGSLCYLRILWFGLFMSTCNWTWDSSIFTQIWHLYYCDNFCNYKRKLLVYNKESFTSGWVRWHIALRRQCFLYRCRWTLEWIFLVKC